MDELPNDLKHLYITWIDESATKFQARQQKQAMLFNNASRTLRNHSEPVRLPEELLKLKGFGPWIVKQMRQKLEEYCKEEGYDLPAAPEAPRRGGSKRTTTDDASDQPTKRATRKKAYVPRRKTGAYSILLVLLEFDPDMKGLTKDFIAQNATPYCETSFSANPSTNNFYSAWNSVKTLIKEELVIEHGRPARYYLTDEGKTLAEKIKENDSIVFRAESASQQREGSQAGSSLLSRGGSALTASQWEEPQLQVRIPQGRCEKEHNGVKYFYWEPGSYDVKFIVDNREMRSQQERDFFGHKLEQLGVDAAKKALTLGDGLWIARNKQTNEEAVLNYILERKRLDDLASSIQDGRYTEQKSRLKRTGITNVYYLIEEVTSSDIGQMSVSIQTAISQALTVSNFHIQRTKDADGTVQFIAKLTAQIKKHYAKKRLLVLNPNNMQTQHDYKTILDDFRINFMDHNTEICHQYFTFDAMLSKTAMMTARELFVRMLMTIRGVSLEKAIAIQKEFRTPKIMFERFDWTDPGFQQRHGKKIAESLGEVFASK
ncbi:Crossover junction endonuclease MUS81 [Cyberlindnera fabianii]|uniref:Crossover junction endonuclease MUS81 n=1 Tax=Cyberlindnera fabianii TaxID=36022 RepID=A0A1V2L1I5_CYBFA|nr:Crossover junction endonuclease MUS81 [Cyberlindnera fabianii]